MSADTTSAKAASICAPAPPACTEKDRVRMKTAIGVTVRTHRTHVSIASAAP